MLLEHVEHLPPVRSLRHYIEILFQGEKLT